MKNIIFLFTSTSQNTPQIDWYNENLSSENIRIILIFILTENFYYITDTKLLNTSFKINNLEYEKRKLEVKDFLERVSTKLNVSDKISKIILCGEQKEKISFVIKKIGASAIVVGPDVCNQKSYFIFQSMEDYLCKNAETAVIKVDK